MDERTPLIGENDKKKKSHISWFKHSDQKVEQFYRRQNDLIETFEEDDKRIYEGTPKETVENTAHGDNVLSKIVLLINVFLLCIKITVTYLTSASSLSVISTLLDSVVDITSGLVIWYAAHSIEHTDIFMYPRGRIKLENMSIIFIGIIMGMANFFVLFQSVNAIITSKVPPVLDLISLCLMLTTILTKSILWIACVKRGSTSSRVLAIDQRNDVLTNAVAIGGAAGSKWWPLADPVAASLIASYIAYSWITVVLEQFPQMSGLSCTAEEYSRITRVCVEHSPRIKSLDTLLAYHVGEKLRVEVHVVLDPTTPCRIVHDEVVAPLQSKLELLDIVDRAFVHADYECDGHV